MQDTTAREKVLKSIRNALLKKNDNLFFNAVEDEKIYSPVDPLPELAFAEALKSAGGNFIYCEDEHEMLRQLSALITQKKWEQVITFNDNIEELLKLSNIPVVNDTGKIAFTKAGITLCESLIARLGTVVVSSAVSDGRRLSFTPESHIVIAYASQVVPDIKQALKAISLRYGNKLPSFITMITGPSRTADIEKTLVMGVHGPKELYVFLIDDNSNNIDTKL